MIKGIDVVFIHTPHQELANWYEQVLGLPRGSGDSGWQEFRMESGSRFALDFTGYSLGGGETGDHDQLPCG